MLIQIKEKGRDRSIMLGYGAADALCKIAHLKGFVVFRNSSPGHAAMVPLGWVIGAPALGYIADRFGRRKPVLIGGAVFMLVLALVVLYLPHDIVHSYVAGLLLGIGSGSAMIPYTIIKEVNADEVKGSATGAINFLVFTLSALMAPVYGWVLVAVSNGGPLDLPVFQKAGIIGVGGIVLAIILSCFIRETGTAVLGRKTGGGSRLLVAPVVGEAK